MSKYDISKAADQYPHVKAIMTAIAKRKDDAVKAKTTADAFFFQLRAAHRVDVFEPLTPDQSILNEYLKQIQAGQELCEYAWELYAKKAAR